MTNGGKKGYTYEELRAAAGSDNGSTIYDSIYSCRPNGVIEYNRYCGVGKCDRGSVMNANCLP